MTDDRPTILITGVSSGIGRACALLFAETGWRVIGTTRTGMAPALSAAGVEVRALELGAGADIRGFAERVLSETGTPDVLLNNASVLQFGSVEDTSPREMRDLFEVNVFSQIDLIRTFVPAMRTRGTGTIANVTSLGGRLVFPFFTVYNASKHALEGFSEGLWHELKPFGIRVKVIEPGYVDTPIYDKAIRPDGEVRRGSEPYRRFQERMAAFEHSITRRTSPAEAAEEIFEAVTDDGDTLRYTIAAYASILVGARRVFGDMAEMRVMHDRWMGE